MVKFSCKTEHPFLIIHYANTWRRRRAQTWRRWTPIFPAMIYRLALGIPATSSGHVKIGYLIYSQSRATSTNFFPPHLFFRQTKTRFIHCRWINFLPLWRDESIQSVVKWFHVNNSNLEVEWISLRHYLSLNICLSQDPWEKVSSKVRQHMFPHTIPRQCRVSCAMRLNWLCRVLSASASAMCAPSR